MKSFFIIALRNLVAAKRRTLMVGSAIALVTMVFVFTLSISHGLQETLLEAYTTLFSGHVNVGGFFKAKADEATPIITERDAIRAVVGERLAGSVTVVERQWGRGRLISETDAFSLLLVGVEIENETDLVESLRLATDDSRLERLAEKSTIALFESQAERLGLTVGDRLTLRARLISGTVNTADVEVIAVVKDVGFLSSFTVFIHADTVRELYRFNEQTIGVMMVYLDEPEHSAEVMASLRSGLEQADYDLLDHSTSPFRSRLGRVANQEWTGKRLELSTWEDELSDVRWIMTGLSAMSSLLVAVLSVIVGVGIINTMRIAIRERTQEIGTLRAIGMGRFRVLVMVMLEAVLLGASFAFIGATLGTLGVWAIDAAEIPIPIEALRLFLFSDVLHLALETRHVVLAVLAFTGVTVLAASGPALRATRMQPVTAIQQGG